MILQKNLHCRSKRSGGGGGQPNTKIQRLFIQGVCAFPEVLVVVVVEGVVGFVVEDVPVLTPGVGTVPENNPGASV